MLDLNGKDVGLGQVRSFYQYSPGVDVVGIPSFAGLRPQLTSPVSEKVDRVTAHLENRPDGTSEYIDVDSIRVPKTVIPTETEAGEEFEFTAAPNQNASLNDFLSAVLALRYTNEAAAPNTDAPRSIRFDVYDGPISNIPAAYSLITVHQVNAKPELDEGVGQNSEVRYNEGGPAVLLAPAVTASDDSASDRILQVAVIEFVDRPGGNSDMLSLDDSLASQLSLTVFQYPEEGKLIITGPASTAAFSSILQTVAYSHSADNKPTKTPRKVKIYVTDLLGLQSNVVYVVIYIHTIDVPPAIDLSVLYPGTGYTAIFIEQLRAIKVVFCLEIKVVLSSLVRAVVKLRNPGTDGSAQTLWLPEHGTLTVTYDPVNIELVITGNGSLWDYQNLLEQVQYNNTVDEPDSSYVRHVDFYVVDSNNLQSEVATSNITIQLVNDYTPVFDQSTPKSIAVLENTAPGSVLLTLTATDLDSGSDSELSYSLARTGGPFSVANANQTGVLTLIRELDSETTASFHLCVIVKDGGSPVRSAELNLTVVVVDVNDNCPHFVEYPYIATWPENASPGVILTVTAIDLDSSANITYWFTGGNEEQAFAVDSKSGVIMPLRQFDRETVSSYTLNVSASDQGNPPCVNHTLVIITVGDENDNAPNFTQSVYTVSVQENVTIGQLLVHVEATDVDSSESENNVIQYSIDPAFEHTFAISPQSGEVTTSQFLDYETTRLYKFQVTATDKNGSANGLNATAWIIITVVDINDNAPEFVGLTNNTISENSPAGITVFIIVVKDADSGENARVSLAIVSGNDGTFNLSVVNTTHAIVSTTRVVDYEAHSVHTITIQAIDNPDRLGTGGQFVVDQVFTLIIENANDHNPVVTSTTNVTYTEPFGDVPGYLLVQPNLTVYDGDNNEFNLQNGSAWLYPTASGPRCLGRNGLDVCCGHRPGGFFALAGPLYFNGTQEAHFLVDHLPLGDTSKYVDQLTVSAWVKQTKDDLGYIISYSDNIDVMFSLYARARYDDFAFRYAMADDTTNSRTVTVVFEPLTVDLRDEQWHHFAVVVDFPRITLVVDGVEEVKPDLITYKRPADGRKIKDTDSKELPFRMLNVVNGVLRVGASQHQVANDRLVFTGTIASVMIHDTAVTVSVLRCIVLCGQYLRLRPQTDTDDLTVTENSLTGRIDVLGSAGAEVYERILRSVEYVNLFAEPDDQSSVSIAFQVHDSPPRGYSVVVRVWITICLTNDHPPLLDLDRYSPGINASVISVFEEESSEAVNIVVWPRIVDYDKGVNLICQLRVRITDGSDIGKELLVDRVPPVDITSRYSASSFTLIVNSSDISLRQNVTQWENFVGCDYYRNLANEPSQPGRPDIGADEPRTRLISFEVYDCALWSVPAYATIQINMTNDRPVIDLNPDHPDGASIDNEVTFTEGQAPVKLSAPNAAIEDPDDESSTQLYINLTNPLDGTEEYILVWLPQTAMSLILWGNGSHLVSVNGTASKSDYEEIIRSARYFHSDDESPSTGIRRVTFRVKDTKDAWSPTASSFVTFQSVNDPPILDLNGATEGLGIGVVFVEDSGSVAIVDPGVSILDVDSDYMSRAIVCLQPLLDGDDERLTAAPAFGIHVTYNASCLELSEIANKSEYRHVLGSVKYENTLDEPSAATRWAVFTITDDDGATSDPVQATIRIVLINDHSPVFGQVQYTGTVSETASLHYSLLTVNATDADRGFNTTISYSIVSPITVPFTVDPQNGTVSIVGPLDYELHMNYTFTIVASDNGVSIGYGTRTGQTTVVVAVEDENDNAPVFEPNQTTFFTSVYEDANVGSLVFDLNATDRDSGENARLNYTIDAGNEDGRFEIDAFSGQITVRANLDRETISVYSLNVSVWDNGSPRHQTSAEVVVSVLDVNDNTPVFERALYTTSIKEELPPGQLVIQVSASDLDTGLHGRITYSITGSVPNNSFVINRTNGVISTAAVLDREALSTYDLIVEATDFSNDMTLAFRNTTAVHIDVIDVNDNAPVFPASPSQFSVPENSAVGTLLIPDVIHAFDSDTNENAHVSYSIVSSRFSGLIRISSGVLSVNGSLDREELIGCCDSDCFNLTVRATDNGTDPGPLFTDKEIVVCLQDENDNRPIFDRVSYSAEVYENATIRSRVITIHATDADDGLNSELVFTINTGDDGDVFDVETVRGANSVDVIVAKKLDHETQQYYELGIQANDSAPPGSQLSGYTIVNVSVLDVNDNDPQIGGPFTVYVLEDISVATPIFDVNATDADSGDNGRLTYFISSGNTDEVFSIVPETGVLKTAGYLDRESPFDPYTLDIVVRDNGQPSRSVETVVTVRLLDVNDNPPNFTHSSYRFSVSEDESVYSTVYTIVATDADHGSNAVITYSLPSNETVPFAVNPQTGAIILQRSLDRENKASYEFEVVATDNGGLIGNASVYITVGDVNDNAPIADPYEYVVTIPENSTPGTKLRLRSRIAWNDSYPTGRYYRQVEWTSDDRAVAVRFCDFLWVQQGWRIALHEGTYVGGENCFDKNQELVWFQRYDLRVNKSERVDAHIELSDDTRSDILGKFRLDPNDDTAARYLDIRTRFQLQTLDVERRLIRFAAESYATGINGGAGGLYACDLLDGTQWRSNYTYNVDDIRNCTQGFTERDLASTWDKKRLYAYAGFNGRCLVLYGLTDRYPSRQPSLVDITTVGGKAFVKYDCFPGTRECNVPDDSAGRCDSSLGENASTRVKLADTDILVYDPDEGQNANVSFHTSGGPFVVDPATGVLTVQGSLDRERLASYNITVEIIDHGVPQLTGTARVLVTVGDVNDNSPQFDQTMYIVEVPENVPNGTVIANITSTDADAGLDGQISYYVSQTLPFSINEYGELYTTGSLDFETAAVYRFEVTARDGGQVSRSSTVNVTVDVININDNLPSIDVIPALSVDFYEEMNDSIMVADLVQVSDEDGDYLNATVTILGAGDGASEVLGVNTSDFPSVRTRYYPHLHRLSIWSITGLSSLDMEVVLGSVWYLNRADEFTQPYYRTIQFVVTDGDFNSVPETPQADLVNVTLVPINDAPLLETTSTLIGTIDEDSMLNMSVSTCVFSILDGRARDDDRTTENFYLGMAAFFTDSDVVRQRWRTTTYIKFSSMLLETEGSASGLVSGASVDAENDTVSVDVFVYPNGQLFLQFNYSLANPITSVVAQTQTKSLSTEFKTSDRFLLTKGKQEIWVSVDNPEWWTELLRENIYVTVKTGSNRLEGNVVRDQVEWFTFPVNQTESSATLLGPVSCLDFTPPPDFNGKATLHFKAWDLTVGSPGDVDVDTTGMQPTREFSTAPPSVLYVLVTAVNDPPVIRLSGDLGPGYRTTFLEDGPYVDIVDSNRLSITDKEGDNIVSSRVRITGPNGLCSLPGQSGAESDEVRFTAPRNGLNMKSLKRTGELCFEFYIEATIADGFGNNRWEVYFRSAQFLASRQPKPGGHYRLVYFSVRDASAWSEEAIANVSIILIRDDKPVIDLGGKTTVEFCEGSQNVSLTGETFDISDADPNQELFAVTLTLSPVDDYSSLAVETFGDVGPLSYKSETGRLELLATTVSQTASLAQFVAVLRTLVFRNTADEPDPRDRTVTIVAYEFGITSVPAVITVTTKLVSDHVPVLDLNSTSPGNGISAVFTEDGPPVRIASTDVSIMDSDIRVGPSVTYTVLVEINNPRDGRNEILSADTSAVSATLTARYDEGWYTLNISGTATLQEFEDILGTVSYQNKKEEPTTGQRTISFTIIDGQLSSTPVYSTVAINLVNDPPIVDLDGPTDNDTDYATLFVEDLPAVAISKQAQISDGDSAFLTWVEVTLEEIVERGSNTVALPVRNDSLFEYLLWNVTVQGISSQYNQSTGILQLSGRALLSAYSQAVDGVRYVNTNSRPRLNPRRVKVVASDGLAISVPSFTLITIQGALDPPIVDLNGLAVAGRDSQVDFVEEGPPVALAPSVSITDEDSTFFSSATVTLRSVMDGQSERLIVGAFDPALKATSSSDDHVISFTAASLQGVNAALLVSALHNVKYGNSEGDPKGLQRYADFVVKDVEGSSSIRSTVRINIKQVNDRPTLKLCTSSSNGGFTTTFIEGGVAVPIAGITDSCRTACPTTASPATASPATASPATASPATASPTTASPTTPAYTASTSSVSGSGDTGSISASGDIEPSLFPTSSDSGILPTKLSSSGREAPTENSSTDITSTSSSTPRTPFCSEPYDLDDVDSGTLEYLDVVVTAPNVSAVVLIVDGCNQICRDPTVDKMTIDVKQIRYRYRFGRNGTVAEYRTLLRRLRFREISPEPLFPSVEQVVLDVSVSDGQARSAVRQTRITIIPVNDNPPLFSNETYALRVKEDATIGKTIVQLVVTDNDAGETQLTYSFTTPVAVVAVNSVGAVVLRKALDYENTTSYDLTVRVSDGQLESTARLFIEVVDANDNPPVFAVHSVNASVPENAVNYSVAVVQATDRDTGANGRISYFVDGFDSSSFTVNSAGRIATLNPLDRESTQRYSFFLVAVDNGDPSLNSSIPVYVRVKDENDNRPVLSYSPTRLVVSEGAAPGEVVGQFTASDADATVVNSEVYFFLANASFDGLKVFTINNKTGRLTVKGKLDRERYAFYTLTVRGLNYYVTPQLGDDVVVQVSVTDINDNEPQFVPPFYTVVNVTEDIAPFTSIVQVSSIDLDIDARPLYSTTESLPAVFALNASTGVISLAGGASLDRESVSSYSIVVTVVDEMTDRASSTANTTQVIINILDVNDNAPTFNQTSYTAQTEEERRPPVDVLTVRASDPDLGTNGDVTFSIVDRFLPFSIDPVNGVISTDSYLDYEAVKRYSFVVRATDRAPQRVRKSAEVRVTVNVLDVNDHTPVFGQDPYTAEVAENDPVGTFVADVSATDKDEGAAAVVTYHLTEQNSKNFTINATTGRISTTVILDREQKAEYRLYVTATDAGVPPNTVSVPLIVKVRDVNDNAPVFSDDPYVISVSEMETVGSTVGHVTATDADIGTNGRVTYSVVNHSSPLVLQSSTSGILLLSQMLDYEMTRSYVIVVSASDGTFTRNVTVIVKVIDSNDNPPELRNTTFTFSVQEGSPAGVLIGRISASDADSGRNALLSFAFPTAVAEFTISNTSGELSTGLVPTDRETKSTYRLIVAVTNVEAPHFRQDAVVVIHITDVNDNCPEFSASVYNPSVYENQPSGTSVITVIAFDPDEGTNAQFDYGLKGDFSSYFRIDASSGLVTTNKTLDREAAEGDRYILNVTATDQGSPTRKCSATLNIAVLDENDNTPVFVGTPYNFDVLRTATLPFDLGKLTATDADKGANAKLRYLVLPNVRGFVDVHANTGVLTLLMSIGGVDFPVYVVDGGVPRRAASTVVTLTILDINENPPRFKGAPYTASVPENLPVRSTVFNVVVTDEDSGQNGEVTLSIDPVTDPDDIFGIYQNGTVFLQRSLDRETRHFYRLTIVARDNGIPDPFFSNASLNISVTDVNDNTPLFLNDLNVTTVNEDIAVGTTIFTVSAEDPDAGSAGQVTYSLSRGFGTFNVNTTTGIITTASPLDFESRREYILVVDATDGANPPRSDAFSLIVKVRDVNDNAPQFRNTPYAETVSEGAVQGNLLLTVLAVDVDSGQNAAVVYSLHGLGAEDFSFDNVTGQLKTRVPLDCGRICNYNLVVTATDGGTPSLNTSEAVIISVTDLNNHSPKFIGVPYSVPMREDTPLNTDVFQVTAVDGDVGLNKEISFAFNKTQSHFVISSVTGVISLTDTLDYETTRRYFLEVSATDGGTPMRSTVTTVVVNVEDVDDNRPVVEVPLDETATFVEGSGGVRVSPLIELSDKDNLSLYPVTVAVVSVWSKPDGGSRYPLSGGHCNHENGDLFDNALDMCGVAGYANIMDSLVVHGNATVVMEGNEEVLILDGSHQSFATANHSAASQNFTVAAWFSQKEENNGTLVERRGAGLLSSLRVDVHRDSQSPAVLLWLAGTEYRFVLKHSDLPANEWHHVAIVIGSVVTLYVDGKRISSVSRRDYFSGSDSSYVTVGSDGFCGKVSQLFMSGRYEWSRGDIVCVVSCGESLFVNVTAQHAALSERYDYRSRTLTLTALPTLQNASSSNVFQSVLQCVAFKSSLDEPDPAGRQIAFTARDTVAFGNKAKVSIAIDPVNDHAPVLDLNGPVDGINYTAQFVEDSTVGVSVTDRQVSLSDGDSGVQVFVRLTVTLDNPVDGNNERLQFVSGYRRSSDLSDCGSSQHEICLRGPAGSVPFTDALKAIEYVNDANEPNSEARRISFTVYDKGEEFSNSPAAVTTVTIVRVNDRPILDLDSLRVDSIDAYVNFTEGDAGVQLIQDTGVTLTDDDAELQGASAQLTARPDGNMEYLTFDNKSVSSITGSYSHSTGILTLTGTATLADYLKVLQSVQYHNDHASPGVPDTRMRLVTFTVTDGNSNSVSATVCVTFTNVNDPPVVDLNGSVPGHNTSVTFFEKVNTCVKISSSHATIVDVDSQHLSQLVASLLSFADGANMESLQFMVPTAFKGIVSSNYDTKRGVLTITGNASVVDYETFLRSVEYCNTASDPSSQIRSITARVDDTEGASSSAVTSSVRIVPYNDPPTLELTGGATFVEAGPAVALVHAGNVNISDSDSNTFSSAEVVIVNPLDNALEVISLGCNHPTGVTTSSRIVLGETFFTAEFSSPVSADTMASLLETIQYKNTASEPDDTEDRIVAILITDSGGATSNVLRISIKISLVNDNSPQFSARQVSISVKEDIGHGSLVIRETATDADAGSDGVLTYSIPSTISYDVDGTGRETGTLFFTIGSQPGTLVTASTLDREEYVYHRVGLRATDSGSSPRHGDTSIIVNVTDVNDNSPEFNQTVYRATLDQTTAVGVWVVTVLAADDDSDKLSNGAIAGYTLTGGHTDDRGSAVFAVDSQGTVTTAVSLLTTSKLDYNITVRSADKGHTPLFGYAHILVTVNIVNAFAPLISPISTVTFRASGLLSGITLAPSLTITDNDHNAEIVGANVTIVTKYGSDPAQCSSDYLCQREKLKRCGAWTNSSVEVLNVATYSGNYSISKSSKPSCGGEADNALQLYGGSPPGFGTIVASDIPDLVNRFTVSLTFKQNPGNLGYVFFKGTTGNDRFGIWIRDPISVIYLIYHDAGGVQRRLKFSHTGFGGKYGLHQIVMLVDYPIVQLYMNCSFSQTRTMSQPIPSHVSEDLIIGKRINPDYQFYNGTVEGYFIHPSILTTDQIKCLCGCTRLLLAPDPSSNGVSTQVVDQGTRLEFTGSANTSVYGDLLSKVRYINQRLDDGSTKEDVEFRVSDGHHTSSRTLEVDVVVPEK